MHTLEITNFDPIKNAQINVSDFLILIGPQSSGKSTIAKLIYFFLHIRDEVTAFILAAAEDQETRNFDRDMSKKLRNRFLEFFGPAPQPREVRVRYTLGPGQYMEVYLDKEHHKFINVSFSENMHTEIRDLLLSTQREVHDRPKRLGFVSAVSKISSEHDRIYTLNSIKARCNEIFQFHKELFFIPAGRSMLSTLSDQMQLIHPHQLDFPMRQFVETVNGSRGFFSRSMSEIVQERKALTTEKIPFASLRKAEQYVKRVLNGEYRYDKEGGKIFLSDNSYTKMSYASSGQQESVWILLSLFLVVLEKTEALVFIEEPEAHLFPTAQKEVLEYIAFVFNEIGCSFVVTTHSPYVLACVNNLTYASKLGSLTDQEYVQKVIPKEQWLPRIRVGGFFVKNGTVESLESESSSELRTELLDVASDEVNAQFDSLLEIERKVSKRAR